MTTNGFVNLRSLFLTSIYTWMPIRQTTSRKTMSFPRYILLSFPFSVSPWASDHVMNYFVGLTEDHFLSQIKGPDGTS